MEIFKKIAPFRAFLKEIRGTGKSIGLVPTMGALHKGHLALIKTSQAENSLTVCSIYVNPTQFNNPVDLQKYPRTLDKDVDLLEKVGCDVVFCPDNDEMYEGESQLHFDFGVLDKVMEGRFRPGHFSGVALVVSKFFNIVLPDNAYFGQKDWQQFAIIKKVVEELKFNIQLHSIPTYREHDGLAMSSRNLRLSGVQREKATVFYHALMAAKDQLNHGKDVRDVKLLVNNMINGTQDVRLEYFEVADSTNLNVLDFVNGAKKPILCIAGYVGDVRLIDNTFLD
ncbi:MAG TPA: pantoate--beta-alanine ligase [Chryseolinea sp.]|nr:pantoate--beta-alanine ligase [Chryseolinea sp.]